MSLKQKLSDFCGNIWISDIDLSLSNTIYNMKNELLKDEFNGKTMLNDFYRQNENLFNQATPEFNDKFQKMINESKQINEEYHGYWDQTSLLIFNRRGNIIAPEVVRDIKIIAKEKYGTTIKDNPEKKGFSYYLTKIDLSSISNFEEDIQELDKNLIVRPVTMSNKLNKAEKMNKQEKNKTMAVESTIYEKAMTLLESQNYGYESNALKTFIDNNISKVTKLCESGDVIDVHRLYALMENSTADINVPELAVTPLQFKNRLSGFDPYKNAGNVDKNTKSVIKFSDDTLKESISNMDIDKIFVLNENILTTNKYSNVLVECNGKHVNLTIDKTNFIQFIRKNVDVKKYMNEKKEFDYHRYLSTRPKSFSTILFREYFSRMLNESSNSDIQIDDVSIDENTNQVEIIYYYPQDTESTSVTFPLDEFYDFIMSIDGSYTDFLDTDDAGNEDYPYGFPEPIFNFDEYWRTKTSVQQNQIIKSFLNSKGGLNEDTKNAVVTDDVVRTDDYNQWKSLVATHSNNRYHMNRVDENRVVAKNDDGEVFGVWEQNKSEGYVEK